MASLHLLNCYTVNYGAGEEEGTLHYVWKDMQ